MKRILSFVLCIMMLVMLLPVNALAEGVNADDSGLRYEGDGMGVEVLSPEEMAGKSLGELYEGTEIGADGGEAQPTDEPAGEPTETPDGDAAEPPAAESQEPAEETPAPVEETAATEEEPKANAETVEAAQEEGLTLAFTVTAEADTIDEDGAAHYVVPCAVGDTLTLKPTYQTNGTPSFAWQLYDANATEADCYVAIDPPENETALTDTLALTVEQAMLEADALYRCVVTVSRGEETVAGMAYFTLTAALNTVSAASVGGAIVITAPGEQDYVQLDDTLQLSAAVPSASAAGTTIRWTSSNDECASVDQNGLVTGVCPGTVTITAVAQDGSAATGAYALTVSAPAQESSLDWSIEGQVLTISGAFAMVDYAAGEAPWAEGADSVVSVVLEEGVKSIARYAFFGFSLLSDIFIPMSASRIAEGAIPDDGSVGIRCPADSYAQAYAFAHGITCTLQTPSTPTYTTCLDRTNCAYTADHSSALVNGRIQMRAVFAVKAAQWDSLSAAHAMFLIPSNVQLLGTTVCVGGEPCTDYAYAGGILTVALTAPETEVCFAVKATDANTLRSYAAFTYEDDTGEGCETVGFISDAVASFSFYAASTVADTEITVSGTAPAAATVRLYVNDVSAGSAVASSVGVYEQTLSLGAPTADAVFTLKAVCAADGGTEHSLTRTVYYKASVPALTSFMYYANGGLSNAYDLLAAAQGGTTPELVLIDSAVPYQFSIAFADADAVESVYVVSTKNGIQKNVEAVFDEGTGKFTTNSFFDPNDRLYEPGKLSVEYTLKSGKACVGDDVDWAQMNGYGGSALEATVNNTEETGTNTGTIDFSEIGSDLAEVAVDYTIRTLDKLTDSELKDYMDAVHANKDLLSYVVPGVDDTRYRVYLDYSDPENLLMIVEDITGAAKSVVEYSMRFTDQSTQQFVALTDASELLSEASKVTKVLKNTYNICKDMDELEERIWTSDSIVDKPAALKTLDELKCNEAGFVVMTTLLPLIVTTVGITGPAAIGFSAIIGVMKSLSDVFFNQRISELMGESCETTWSDNSSTSFSGKFGDNISYQLTTYTIRNEKGTASKYRVLKFSGAGDMPETATKEEKQDLFYRQYSYPQEIIVGEGITSLTDELLLYSDGTAYNNITLKSITLPSTLRTIGESAFAEARGLTSINIPDGVTTIGASAFSRCQGITSIKLPSALSHLGGGAFYDCIALKSVIFPTKPFEIASNDGGGAVFGSCLALESVTLAYGMTEIPASLFYQADTIQRVTIPSTVTEIKSRAFSGCTGLTQIALPPNLETIGDKAFENCTGITSIVLPKTLQTVGTAGCFNGCTKLTDVELEAGATMVPACAFVGLKTALSVTLPAGLTEIGSCAFYQCTGLTELSLPTGLTTIRSDAFRGCTALAEMALPTSVTTIEEYAFYYCSSLTSISIPNGVESVEDSAFRGCSSLVTATLGSGIKAIRDRAFYGCTNLTTALLPAGLESIGERAFYNCTSLTGLVLPDGLSSLGEDTFHNCSSFTSITIPGSLDTIPGGITGGCFNGCSSVEEITIQEGVTTIQYGALERLSSLTTVEIPASVTTIEDGAFFGCDNLTTVKGQAGSAAQTFAAENNLRFVEIWLYPQTTSVDILKEGVSVTGQTLSLVIAQSNASLQLTAALLPADAYQRVTWSTNAPRILSVDATGRVAPVANASGEYSAGTATITATSLDPAKKAASVQIAVSVLAQSVDVDAPFFLAVGRTETLSAYISPSGAANAGVIWSIVSGEEYAELDAETGEITGLVPGTVTIRATANDGSGVYGELDIEVIDTSVIVTGESTVLAGKSLNLAASIQPENLTGTSILWSLSEEDGAYAKLTGSNATAKLTAQKVTEAHTVTVHAAAADDSAAAGTLAVAIVPPVTNVYIQQGEEYVTGKTVLVDLNDTSVTALTLAAALYPTDASQAVNWTSSDSAKRLYADSYASDGGSMTVSGFTGKTGTVTLTAKSADGSNKSASVKLQFVRLPQSLTIAAPKTTLRGGESVALTANLGTDALTDKSVLWSLPEAALPYASISSAGKLTTKPVYEETTITITAQAKANARAQDSIELTLCPAVTSVDIRNGGVSVAGQTIPLHLAGETASLTLSTGVLPAGSSSALMWKSSDARSAYSTLTVNDDGTVTLIGRAPKTVTLTATAADGSRKSANVKVQIGRFAQSLSIDNDPMQNIVRVGAPLQLSYSIDPNAANRSVTFRLADAADKAYATVSAAGRVTAKAVYGAHDVDIVCTAKDAGGISDAYTVRVMPALDGILTICNEAGENVTKTTLPLDLGSTTTMQLSARALGNEEAESVTWKSSAPTVATVNNGLVTVLKSGTATITATSATNRSRTATVTVKGAYLATAIEVAPKTGGSTIPAGKSLTLSATVAPTGAAKSVAWSIDPAHGKYASISSSGRLTTKNTITTVTTIHVTATAKDGSGVSGYCDVTVNPAATAVSIRMDGRASEGVTRVVDMNDYPTKQLSLSAVVYPSGVDGANQAVTWGPTSTRGAAYMEQDGTLRLVKSGTVTITAKADNGKTASCKLTIIIGVESESLSISSKNGVFEVRGGGRLNLTPDFGDVIPTNQKVTWSLDPQDVPYAAISPAGVLTAKGVTAAKTVRVTATSLANPAASCTQTVAIKPPVTGVRIFSGGDEVTKQTLTLDLSLNQTSLPLSAVATPSDAIQACVWSSSAKAIALVDESGTVTVQRDARGNYKLGTVTITAKAADGSGRNATVKVRIVP